MNTHTINRTLICFGSLAMAFALRPNICRAQGDGYVTNSNLRGVVPFGSYQFGEIDNINLGTGTLNLNIPIAKRKGRGLDVSLSFNSSKMWAFSCSKDVQGITHCSWFLTTGPKGIIFAYAPKGILTRDSEQYDCTDRLGNSYTQTNLSNYVYVANGGGQYRFPNSSDTSSPPGHSCTGGRTISTGVSDMGDMELDTSPTANTVFFKDGHQESVGPGVSYGATDANGNQINSAGDTLKRLFTFTTPTLTLNDSNGVAQSYTMSYTNSINLAPNFPSTTCVSAAIAQYSAPWFENQSLSLPSGLQFKFTYDPNFGEITRIDLPTGGYIRYAYTTLSQFDIAPPAPCTKIDSRRVANRYVSADGNPAHEQTWTYAYALNGCCYTTTVTDPLGFVTVHTFNGDGIHETQTQFYDQSNHLLRTIANTWASDGIPVQTNQKGNAILDNANWRITTTTETLADTNQISQTSTTFDSYTVTYSYGLSPTTYTTSRVNPVDVRSYDYGSGAAGILLRRTTFTYLHDSNSNYLNKHILDRLASKVVYDSTNNTCQAQSQPCAQTTFSYDTTAITATSGVVQHDYTNFPSTMTVRGNVTLIQNWRNTDGAWLTATKYYDDLGNLRQTQDPLAHNTFFDYTDSFSATGNVCVPSGGTAQAFVTKITNHLNQFSTYSYYSCSSFFASATDLNSQTTSFAYDMMDRQLQTTNPDGGQQTNCYSEISGGSCYSASTPLYVTSTTKITSSPLLNLISTSYLDGLGRLHKTILNSDPNGAIYTRTDYDAFGRKSTVWNPTRCDPDVNPTSCTGESTFGTTQFQFDALGRSTKVIPPDGTVSANNLSTVYSGNCTTVTDQAGKSRKSCSDGLGRLTQVFEDQAGSNYETDYTYDTLDNLLTANQKGGSTNSANWRTRTFTYNSLSQLLTAANPESGTITYSYDNNGNVQTKVAPAPNQPGSATATTTYSYDGLNRLTSKSYSDGTTPSAYYYYDQSAPWGWNLSNYIGRKTTQGTYSGGSWQTAALFNHDPLGRVSLYEQCTPLNCTGSIPSFTVSYTYDLMGDVTSVSNGGYGITFYYQYDGAGRPNQITSSLSDAQHPGTVLTVDSSVGYFPHGALRKAALGNGLTVTNVYNNRLQPCLLDVNNSNVTLQTCSDSTPTGNILDFWMGYNAGSSNNGNVANWNATGAQSFVRTYTYDSLNRIATMADSNTGQACRGLSWTIDPWGNRTDQSVTAGTCNTFHQATDGSNRLLGAPYQYDAAGNMTYDGSHSYTYDAENRLTQVDGGNTATYVYDADGNRVKRTVAGADTHYIYGLDGNVINEVGGNNVSNADYIYLSGRLIAEYRNSTTYFAHLDHLGSTRLLTAMDQSVYDSLDYLPFGEQIAGDTGTTHKFTGKQRDSESGLDNFGARYFASSFSRFMSPDTPKFSEKTDPQSWNLYSYVANNPLSRIDPTGRNWFCVGGSKDQKCHWEWHKGNKYTYTNSSGKSQTLKSDYTHLLVILKTGHLNLQGAAEVRITLYGNSDPATSKPLAQAYGFTGGPGVAPVPNGNYEINLNNRGGVETNRELAVAAGYVLAPFHDGIQEVGSSVPVPGGLGYANPQEEWGALRANLSSNGVGTSYYLHGKGLYFTEGHAYTAGCVCDPYLDVLKPIFKLDPSGVGEGAKNGRIAAAVEKAPN